MHKREQPPPVRLRPVALISALGLLLLTGCLGGRPVVEPARRFDLSRDAFAFNNDLRSTYDYDEKGHWTRTPLEPTPEFSLRCFVVARAARQFFDHAHFDPEIPRVSDAEYARLANEVLHRSRREPSLEAERVVIPGYASLREFSAAHETAVKQACGSAVESYAQRGHWRMVFGFSKSGQEKRADAIAGRVRAGRPVVVHIVDFPSLHINHALVLTGVEDTPEGMRFTVYDPNDGSKETHLDFNRATRTWRFPKTPYFRGGEVNIYEVYRDWLY